MKKSYVFLFMALLLPLFSYSQGDSSFSSSDFESILGAVFSWVIPIIIVLVALMGVFFVVKQQRSVIIERFGKYQSIRNSGLQLKIPIVDRIAGVVSLKIQQLDVIIETKTFDDVFVKMKVSVQYLIQPDKVYDAFYKLSDPEDQITSYVFDVVRAEVPKMKLDDVFVKKDDVAIAIKKEISEAMDEYGYRIVKALVTDIDPDAAVKESMNRINAAEREKTAAEFEGESERIKIVAKATAEKESKILQGEGIAGQRMAIANGLEQSVSVLSKAGIDPKEASALIVVTQHYDTLQHIGQKNKSSLILMPNSPGAAQNVMADMLTALQANDTMAEIAEIDED